MASATQLTPNDIAVLGAIFDPEGTRAKPQYSQLSADASDRSRVLRTAERRIINSINKNVVSEADIREAIAAFDALIKKHPNCSSAYNNRAQARRMLHSAEDLHRHPSDFRLIMCDLNDAIRLASPTLSNTGVTEDQAEVLAAAHTHRGYMFLAASKESAIRDLLGSIDICPNASYSTMEEIASREFSAGGRYGSQLAREMAVRTNPYAKLCGEMVKQAMRAEIKEDTAS